MGWSWGNFWIDMQMAGCIVRFAAVWMWITWNIGARNFKVYTRAHLCTTYVHIQKIGEYPKYSFNSRIYFFWLTFWCTKSAWVLLTHFLDCSCEVILILLNFLWATDLNISCWMTVTFSVFSILHVHTRKTSRNQKMSCEGKGLNALVHWRWISACACNVGQL